MVTFSAFVGFMVLLSAGAYCGFSAIAMAMFCSSFGSRLLPDWLLVALFACAAAVLLVCAFYGAPFTITLSMRG